MIEKLRRHWQTLTITILLLLALSPSPTAEPFLHPLRTARAAIRTGNLKMAVHQLEEALAFEGALAGLHQEIAELAYERGDMDRATVHLAALENTPTLSGNIFCLQQLVNIKIGDLDALDSDWQNLIVDCQEAVPAIQQLALATLDTSGPAESLPILEALAGTDSLNFETEQAYAYAMTAMAPEESLQLLHTLVRQGQQTPALALDLILAVEHSADEGSPAYALAQVGQTFARHGRWNLAIASLEQALAINPDYHEARAYLGLSKDRVGQDGLEDLQAAVEAMPDNALSYTFLAIHWLNNGEEDRAVEALTTAAQLDPENPAIAAQLGEVFTGLGEFTTAAAAYHQAAMLDPKNPVFWLLLAKFSNQFEVEIDSIALPAARNAVALSTRDPAPLTELAYAHFLLGNHILAERLLWRAVALDPENARTQYFLGLFLESTGDRSGAWGAMRFAASLAPGRYQSLAARWLEGAAR
jgi:tetratricopeptide (TPR) repeat protein